MYKRQVGLRHKHCHKAACVNAIRHLVGEIVVHDLLIEPTVNAVLLQSSSNRADALVIVAIRRVWPPIVAEEDVVLLLLLNSANFQLLPENFD